MYPWKLENHNVLSEDTSSGCFFQCHVSFQGCTLSKWDVFFFSGVWSFQKKVVKIWSYPKLPVFVFSTLFQTIPQTPSRRRWRLSQNSEETETHGKCGPAENGQFIDILLGNFLKGIYDDMVVWGISIMEKFYQHHNASLRGVRNSEYFRGL